MEKRLFTFEILSPQIIDDSKMCAGRRQKLTKPLFLTPAGVIEEFPNIEDHFFSLMPPPPILPIGHPLIAENSGYVRISKFDLENSARFKRWANGKKDDTRATLEESYELFKSSGIDGLKKKFSKTHTYYLLREFRKRNWSIT